jgi:hypothetical protein
MRAHPTPDARQLGAVNVPATALFLAILAGAYFAFAYISPWVKSLNAKSHVKEMLSGLTADDIDEDQLSESIQRELNAMNVDVDTSQIRIDLNREARSIEVYIDWDATINFPFTGKHTKVLFKMEIRRKLK